MRVDTELQSDFPWEPNYRLPIELGWQHFVKTYARRTAAVVGVTLIILLLPVIIVVAVVAIIALIIGVILSGGGSSSTTDTNAPQPSNCPIFQTCPAAPATLLPGMDGADPAKNAPLTASPVLASSSLEVLTAKGFLVRLGDD